jgi:hypothetical protein
MRTAAPAQPPAPATQPTAPAPATAAPTSAAKLEFQGDATDIVADELLTATLVNETPEVPMAEFPVLTDAVEAPELRRPPAKPAGTHTVAKHGAPPAAAKSSRPAPPAPAYKPAAAPPRARPEGSAPIAGQFVPGARPTPKPGSHADEQDHETKTMRALAGAKSIDDISSSMAETLFGEADLDMLSSALAAGDWADSDDAEEASAEQPAADTDGLDLFDLGPDAPLELIDDSSLPPQVGGRKRVNDR